MVNQQQLYKRQQYVSLSVYEAWCNGLNTLGFKIHQFPIMTDLEPAPEMMSVSSAFHQRPTHYPYNEITNFTNVQRSINAYLYFISYPSSKHEKSSGPLFTITSYPLAVPLTFHLCPSACVGWVAQSV